jgi:hypothetical protein
MATAKAPSKAGTKGKKPIGPKPGEYPGKIIDIDVSAEMSDSNLFTVEFFTRCLKWACGQSVGM